jgi:hypothetical protein
LDSLISCVVEDSEPGEVIHPDEGEVLPHLLPTPDDITELGAMPGEQIFDV